MKRALCCHYVDDVSSNFLERSSFTVCVCVCVDTFRDPQGSCPSGILSNTEHCTQKHRRGECAAVWTKKREKTEISSVHEDLFTGWVRKGYKKHAC